MSFFPISRGALLGFLVVISVFAAAQCHADEQVIEVKQKKIQTNHGFPGLHVTIDCKNQHGTIERLGVGKLNEEGKFKISIPKEVLKDGNLKHDCYAQLHSASSLAPCLAQNGLKSIKIVAKNDADGKHITFEPVQKLIFSTELCTSATFWPIIIGWHHFHKKPKTPEPEPKTPEPEPKTPEPPVTIPKTPELPAPIPEPPVTIPKTPELPAPIPEPPVTIPKTPELPAPIPEPPVTIPKTPELPAPIPEPPAALPEPPSEPKTPCPPKKEKRKKKKEEPEEEIPPVRTSNSGTTTTNIKASH